MITMLHPASLTGFGRFARNAGNMLRQRAVWQYLLMPALLGSFSVAACTTGVLRSTPDQVFTKHPDGTVTHQTTGLMWTQCLKGQNWDGQTCLGTARQFDWMTLIAESGQYATAGYTDWRLPNKNELASILEVTCPMPALNTNVFSHGAIYGDVTTLPGWTSSRGTGDDIDKMWIVDFANGDISLKAPLTVYGYVRYVRSAN